jgi:hypothetical protein
MTGIDSNYFLLPISVDVCFSSSVGELLGSHHPEEEVAQHRVPTALCMLDRSSCRSLLWIYNNAEIGPIQFINFILFHPYAFEEGISL